MFIFRYLQNMFNGALSFNSELSSWDVASVKRMDVSTFTSLFLLLIVLLFIYFSCIIQFVTHHMFISRYFKYMFSQSSSFNGDVSSWNVARVENMRVSYISAVISFVRIDLSFIYFTCFTWFDFYQMFIFRYLQKMFNRASSFNSDVSSWDVASVKYMDVSTFSSLFLLLIGLLFIYFTCIRQFDTHHMFISRYFKHMFGQIPSFNGDVSSWNVARVEDMRVSYISAVIYFVRIDLYFTCLTQFDFHLMFFSRYLQEMFNGTLSFNGDLSSWNVARVLYMNVSKFTL